MAKIDSDKKILSSGLISVLFFPFFFSFFLSFWQEEISLQVWPETFTLQNGAQRTRHCSNNSKNQGLKSEHVNMC